MLVYFSTHQERELRQQLEGEALDLRQAMADKKQAERVRHAAALTKELTRQENQQQTKPHHQEKVGVKDFMLKYDTIYLLFYNCTLS